MAEIGLHPRATARGEQLLQQKQKQRRHHKGGHVFVRVVPWRSGCNAHAAAAAAYRCLATQHHNITTLAVVTLVPATSRRGARSRSSASTDVCMHTRSLATHAVASSDRKKSALRPKKKVHEKKKKKNSFHFTSACDSIQIVIFEYRKCRNTVATATGHDTVEFLSEKNSKIQPNFKIRLLCMHVSGN